MFIELTDKQMDVKVLIDFSSGIHIYATSPCATIVDHKVGRNINVNETYGEIKLKLIDANLLFSDKMIKE